MFRSSVICYGRYFCKENKKYLHALHLQLSSTAHFKTRFSQSQLGEPKKNNYQILDIVQTWEGAAAQPNFLSKKRYGHVLRGEGGQRASSKVVFCKKVCFGVPEELLCVKIIYILHASKHELQYHIPTQALSEKIYYLIYQKLILYFQSFCVKMSKLQ